MWSLPDLRRMNAKPNPTDKARKFAAENPMTAKEMGLTALLREYDRLLAFKMPASIKSRRS